MKDRIGFTRWPDTERVDGVLKPGLSREPGCSGEAGLVGTQQGSPKDANALFSVSPGLNKQFCVFLDDGYGDVFQLKSPQRTRCSH